MDYFGSSASSVNGGSIAGLIGSKSLIVIGPFAAQTYVSGFSGFDSALSCNYGGGNNYIVALQFDMTQM